MYINRVILLFVDPKKLLVLVNPNSGAGHAVQIFQKNVVPILGEADVPYEVLVTSRANQVLEFMQTVDLNLYRGVVIVSGDGLIYEVHL